MMTHDELAVWKASPAAELRGEGTTYLMAACAAVNLDAVQALLQEGADVNAVNAWTDTALANAVSFCRYSDERQAAGLKIVNLLLDHGADPNVLSRGFPPITLAAVYRLPEILKTLIRHGADVNLPDSDGNTPLQSAVSVRAGKRILKLLTDAGATGSVGTSTDSSGPPTWGTKAPTIVRNHVYEDMAAKYQYLEITRLNEVLQRHGIADAAVRRAICKEYFFDTGCFLDSGWFVSQGEVVWPHLCFAARHSQGDGPIQTLYVLSQSFSFHEYADGDVDWYFGDQQENIGEIEHGLA